MTEKTQPTSLQPAIVLQWLTNSPAHITEALCVLKLLFIWLWIVYILCLFGFKERGVWLIFFFFFYDWWITWAQSSVCSSLSVAGLNVWVCCVWEREFVWVCHLHQTPQSLGADVGSVNHLVFFFSFFSFCLSIALTHHHFEVIGYYLKR